MGRRPSERYWVIARLLSDGHWHHREHIVDHATPHVPYAMAVREREAGKRRQRIRKRYLRELSDPDARHLVRIGARQIINQQLQYLVRAGWVERDGHMFRSLAFHLSSRRFLWGAGP